MLVLASASPRRSMLLEENGFSFVTAKVDVSEELPITLTPVAAVKELALRKASAGLKVWLESGGDLKDVVLGADTIVALGDRILGKPQDTLEAEKMLKSLSERNHAVYTGVAFLNGNGLVDCEAIKTEVYFRNITINEIRDYIATGEPMDKAGAYGIQGLAAAFVDHYEGSLTNVIGLPMEYVTERLSVWGITQNKHHPA